MFHHVLYISGSQPEAIVSLRGHLEMSGDSSGYHHWSEDSTGIEWADTRAAAGHPTVHEPASTTKNDLVSNVESAEAEKPFSASLITALPARRLVLNNLHNFAI